MCTEYTICDCPLYIGVDFGEAYEIPNSLKGVPFHAAVVLKVL
jgi:hypothetical protein